MLARGAPGTVNGTPGCRGTPVGNHCARRSGCHFGCKPSSSDGPKRFQFYRCTKPKSWATAILQHPDYCSCTGFYIRYENWTESGLNRIVCDLVWIRIVNRFRNVASEPCLDCVNGKKVLHFCYCKPAFC